MTYAAQGNRNTVMRMVNAQTRFVALVQEISGMSEADSLKAFVTLRKVKAIKLDPINGVYDVKHGAFMSPEVLRRAAA